jgi:hypothetical protein
VAFIVFAVTASVVGQQSPRSSSRPAADKSNPLRSTAHSASGPIRGAATPPAAEEVLLPDAEMDGAFIFDESLEAGPSEMCLQAAPCLPQFTGFYVRGEYLLWSTSNPDLPPLVTTARPATPRPGAGALGRDTTEILFGEDQLDDTLRSGARIQLGFWLDPCRRVGIEGDFFRLSDQAAGDSFTSAGAPILARPFFNMLTGQESAELVAFPEVIRGTVAVDAESRLQGAGIRLRYALCSAMDCAPACDPCEPCGSVPGGYRLDLLGGYRYMALDDRITVTEDLVSLASDNPGAFLIQDAFSTQNQFNGGEFGVLLECRRGRWTLDLLSKIALGNTQAQVRIAGDTSITENGVTEDYSGGLLAQRTNIGTRSDDRFAVVPELGATLGYDLLPRVRVIVGYTFIYWSQVARAGDQISSDLNPNLLAPQADPFSGALRPAFAFRYTDFWAQGLHLGLEGRF